MDFASPVAYNKKLGNINIVNNLENMDGVVQTHSIDQFAPKPSSISGELVQVERRTLFRIGITILNFNRLERQGFIGFSTGETRISCGFCGFCGFCGDHKFW